MWRAIALALSGANEYVFFAGFVVLQAIVLATAWNILGGYAGYVNFGVPGFVGVGAYSALAVHLLFNAPIMVQILAGAAWLDLLGLAVGMLTLRLRGIFFSIATVAVVFILEAVVMNTRFLGGATGLQLTRPGDVWLFDSYTRMLFVVMTFMAVLAVSIARYVQNSHIGQGLRAVRDSEEAADCSGVPTLKLKLIACAISGALLGVAGAPDAHVHELHRACLHLQFALRSDCAWPCRSLGVLRIGWALDWRFDFGNFAANRDGHHLE